MTIPGRSASSAAYRYGFQGQEKDDELKGEGNSINFKFRMHDPRVGRFFTVDPLTGKYPHYTPYSFSGNKVIHAIELEGLEEQELNGSISPFEGEHGDFNSIGGGTKDVSPDKKIEEKIDGLEFLIGLGKSYNQGFDDRVDDMTDFIVNKSTSSEYWGNTIYNFGSDFANGRTWLNPSNEFQLETFDLLVNMSANDWAYAAGYSSPDIALSMGGPATFNLVRSGVVGLSRIRVPKLKFSLAKNRMTIGNSNVTSSNLPAPYWPGNAGAMGSWKNTTLTPGTRIDRFGSGWGRYFSPEGTPLEMRALAPGSDLSKYNVFEVVKPFTLQESTIAPWFGKVGAGKQYYSPFLNADDLVKAGYLKKL